MKSNSKDIHCKEIKELFMNKISPSKQYTATRKKAYKKQNYNNKEFPIGISDIGLPWLIYGFICCLKEVVKT